MEDSIFKFVEQNDAQKGFGQRLTKDAMGQVLGGVSMSHKASDIRSVEFCDPWSNCDAWNCAPDCTCKSTLC
mgnify:FL=1